MSNETLTAISASLSKISTRIAERVGDADGALPDAIFEECVERELISLRGAGQTALAAALSGSFHPVVRALKEGW